MPQLPVAFEVGTFVVLIAVLLFDLLYVYRRPHIPSMKEAGLWVGFYVGLALVFAVLMLLVVDVEHAGQFVAGWVTEYSLSIDNLFVFIIIMARFKVPRKYQQEVLMVGIIIALVLRGIFILLGAAIIDTFSWVFYLFGVFLLYTAWKQARDSGEQESEGGDNPLIGRLRKVVPVTEEFDGNKLRTVDGGKKVFTPMILVFVTLGLTDLMFAVDSIPAIFGLTTSPFIVFTANIFALMGLRQLYFLLGGLMERLIYLKHALSVILAFIGVKLILHAMHENEVPFINGGHPMEWAPEIPTMISLVVIVGVIVVATVASLLSPKAKALQAVAELKTAIETYRELGEDVPVEHRQDAYHRVVQARDRAVEAASNTRADASDLDPDDEVRQQYREAEDLHQRRVDDGGR
ncbi:tellurium resistance protein TerC [Tersicoccus solisilvae]|uniref:Tellurium resistance protein TerC n=1 Tax=Tersicoccus solisilvae TaxID=1882339 RepID=A0ABQ1P0G8_9MICC|nr:TerC family protein [Tersicoccus solisilvae]GGC88768.1 tellurium resistance protein TerC [Tersicoccus solisilvae]